ncbi:MAG: LptF/LptG family permease [Thermodesulfobacteriaceae bacterium]|nr:LptF/LptG family permease [Thermodesulfobacteriaceae bacterium]MDW8136170.1 LptF/LptG family permease [Thermodesulfobacterium sp.]
MTIFFKYILKEVIYYTLIFWLIFSVKVSLIKGVLVLEELIDFNPSFNQILKILTLVFFQLLSFTLPLSSFMGILFAMHRFISEREMLAFWSLGFSLKDFIKPLIIFSIFMFFITFLSHFFLLPYAKRQQKLIKIELVKTQATPEIHSKKPFSLGEKYILYVKNSEKKENHWEFKGVFLLDYAYPQKKGFFLSKEGSLFFDKGLLLLSNGSAFFWERDKNLEVLKFDKYFTTIGIHFSRVEKLYFTRGEQTLSELKQELNRLDKNSRSYFRYLTEYYQRFGYSFSVIFLILSAFLLNFYLKTSHKFWVFLVGIIFYLFYYLFYNFFISISETGKLHPFISFLTFYTFLTIFIILKFIFIKKKGFSIL